MVAVGLCIWIILIIVVVWEGIISHLLGTHIELLVRLECRIVFIAIHPRFLDSLWIVHHVRDIIGRLRPTRSLLMQFPFLILLMGEGQPYVRPKQGNLLQNFRVYLLEFR
jgi:hypothetical protein